MGLTSVSVAYSMMILSSMFVSPTLMNYLGCKWTAALCISSSAIYSIGNFFPGWPSLMITSVIIGLGAAPLWSSLSTYITIVAQRQAEIDNTKTEDKISQYFGILILAYSSANIWGNLMSSLILGSASETGNVSNGDPLFCGVSSCLNSSGLAAMAERPETGPLNILLGCFVGLGTMGVIVISVFLDNVKEEEEVDTKKSFCFVFFATLRQLRDYRLVLLIPMTIYIGLEISFLSGDFTSVYATCALGIHYVGFVMICFGATSSITSITVGRLSKYTGRQVLISLAAVINLSCIIGLLIWKPDPDQKAVFFVFPALWGMADAIWQTQTNGKLAMC
ncbi:protein unc-93 homolog A-like [Engraulis encrasicolus]|uniref:protein unc-93 homolog A-like n=1 Tax=Engraulis encrasicolus TaxID=184585 RepID=UPI002FD43510